MSKIFTIELSCLRLKENAFRELIHGIDVTRPSGSVPIHTQVFLLLHPLRSAFFLRTMAQFSLGISSSLSLASILASPKQIFLTWKIQQHNYCLSKEKFLPGKLPWVWLSAMPSTNNNIPTCHFDFGCSF